MNKFEKSQTSNSANNGKPRFDLSKQINEINKKKQVTKKVDSYRKMNLNIEIEDNNADKEDLD
jgi:hypothetical protein